MARNKGSKSPNKKVAKRPKQLSLNVAALASGSAGLVVGSIVSLALAWPISTHAMGQTSQVTSKSQVACEQRVSASRGESAEQIVAVPKAFHASSIAGSSIGRVTPVPAASISNSGPNSRNEINTSNERTTTIENTTSITIRNTNRQTAVSGDADVVHNTMAGSAKSGVSNNADLTSFHILTRN